MKGMPGLYYATRESDRPEWIGSVPYVDGDTAEVRRLYQRDDAESMPMEAHHGEPRRRWSLSSVVRRLVSSASATA
jgi:hypothetical protein